MVFSFSLKCDKNTIQIPLEFGRQPSRLGNIRKEVLEKKTRQSMTGFCYHAQTGGFVNDLLLCCCITTGIVKKFGNNAWLYNYIFSILLTGVA